MRLAIYCAGGFGQEVLDVARRELEMTGKWSEIVFVDDVSNEDDCNGAPIHRFEYLASAEADDVEVVIANGEPTARRMIRQKLEAAALRLGNVVDTTTVVAESASFSNGVVITPFCSISSKAELAVNVCVNTASIVGHDVKIGPDSVISSMVNLGGECIIGSQTYIGMGALIKERTRIGSNTIIGMGSVVYDDVPDGVIALGNPAKVVRRNEAGRVFKPRSES